MAQGTEPPSSVPVEIRPAVLDYSGPSTRALPLSREVRYERQEDSLSITIPAPPLAMQLIGRSIMVLVLGFLTVIFSALFIVTVAASRPLDASVYVIVPVAAILLIWQLFRALARLIHTVRHGKSPTLIRAGPDMLEIKARGSARLVNYSWPLTDIADVEIRPGGIFALLPTLLLQITLKDDRSFCIQVPWRSRHPMIEVQDNLRDVLHKSG